VSTVIVTLPVRFRASIVFNS